MILHVFDFTVACIFINSLNEGMKRNTVRIPVNGIGVYFLFYSEIFFFAEIHFSNKSVVTAVRRGKNIV